MTCAHHAQRDRGLGSPGPLPTHTQWTGLQAVGTALGGLVATKHWSPHVRLDTDTAKSQGGHCPLSTQPGPDLCPLRPSSVETVVGVSRRCKRRGSRFPSCAEALTGRRTHDGGQRSAPESRDSHRARAGASRRLWDGCGRGSQKVLSKAPRHPDRMARGYSGMCLWCSTSSWPPPSLRAAWALGALARGSLAGVQYHEAP